jgi:hypothetical protein
LTGWFAKPILSVPVLRKVIFCICVSLNVAVRNSHHIASNDGMMVNSKIENVLHGAIVAYFKLLSGSDLGVERKITTNLRGAGVPAGTRYKHALTLSAKLVLEGRATAPSPQTPQNLNLKNTDFVDITSDVLHDFLFSRNPQQNSADD